MTDSNARQLELFTPKFSLTEVGLQISGDPDYEEWMDYGETLKKLDSTVRQFAVGDWIVAGFDRYQHGKWDAVQQLWGDTERSQLQNYEWVARSVESSTRVEDLSWSHHREVANLPPDRQRYWLQRALDEKLSVVALRQLIRIESWGVKPGQVWFLGDHRIMCGDSRKAEDLDKLIGGELINALITDPPYGIDYQPDWEKWDGSPTDFQEIIGDDEPFDPAPFINYPTVSMFGANYFADKLPPGGWICWDKRLDENKDKMFGSPFELAWYRSVNTTRSAIMIRVLHGGVVNADSKNGNNEKRLHATQKPVAVMERIVNELTQIGDVVLDPFVGSGSTLLACESLGRKCVAMEINSYYVAITLQRWLDKTGVKPWRG